ncbi:hypothetical protein TrRE_jg2822 [Triparma retinervis]|uniref:Uncharacterized protein n=1 Tax=Triparma retinervis TaxID=2557542 RepID=A0A9W7A704_9STRA|nr:hypothetical protein TrRE_jg2822 [Triparma retinervis]
MVDGEGKAATLAISVVLDLLGDASYSIPFIGDASDIAFAPLAGIVLYKLYGSNLLAALGIIEELLPGADFIPTGTIAWYCKNVLSKDNRFRQFLNFEDDDDDDKTIDI